MHFVAMPKGPASRKGKKRPRHNDDEPGKEESPPHKAVTTSHKFLKLHQILFLFSSNGMAKCSCFFPQEINYIYCPMFGH